MGRHVSENLTGVTLGENSDSTLGFFGGRGHPQRSGAAQAAVVQGSANVDTADASDLESAVTLVNAVKSTMNDSVADIAALTVLVNELRAVLVAHHLIPGA